MEMSTSPVWQEGPSAQSVGLFIGRLFLSHNGPLLMQPALVGAMLYTMVVWAGKNATVLWLDLAVPCTVAPIDWLGVLGGGGSGSGWSMWRGPSVGPECSSTTRTRGTT